MTDKDNITAENTVPKMGLAKKIVIYSLASISVILPFLFGNILALWFFSLFTTALFSIFFANSRPLGILFLLLPLFVTLIFNNPIFILITLTFLAAAVSFGISFKKRKSGIEAVRAAFIANLISLAVLTVVIAFIYTNGSVTELFKAAGKIIDDIFAYMSSQLPEEYKSFASIFTSYAAVLKSVPIGALLAIQMFFICATYFISLCVSKLAGGALPVCQEKAFDLRTERFSAYMFLISFLMAAFIPTDPTHPNVIVIAASNLYSVLSPLFFFVGLYYLIRIKYRIEKSRFTSLIVCAVLSFLFGPQLLLWFVTLNGAFHCIKPQDTLNFRRYN